MNDLQPTHILNKKTEEIARIRAEWIDSEFKKAVPAWKMFFLERFPSEWLARLLLVNAEVINEELIADFGTQVYLKLNGKVIAKRKFIA